MSIFNKKQMITDESENEKFPEPEEPDYMEKTRSPNQPQHTGELIRENIEWPEPEIDYIERGS